MDKHVAILKTITGLLLEANAAAPIVFGTITAISALIKAITGSGPSLLELADLMESQLTENDTKLRADIAALKALVG